MSHPASPDPPPPVVLDDFLIPAWAHHRPVLLTGLVVVEIIVRCTGGREVSIRYGPAPHGPAAKPAAETPMGAAILQALAESAGPLTGPKLAERCGYVYAGRFKETAKRLADGGDIAKGHDGYALPD